VTHNDRRVQGQEPDILVRGIDACQKARPHHRMKGEDIVHLEPNIPAQRRYERSPRCHDSDVIGLTEVELASRHYAAGYLDPSPAASHCCECPRGRKNPLCEAPGLPHGGVPIATRHAKNHQQVFAFAHQPIRGEPLVRPHQHPCATRWRYPRFNEIWVLRGRKRRTDYLLCLLEAKSHSVALRRMATPSLSRYSHERSHSPSPSHRGLWNLERVGPRDDESVE